MLIDIISQLKDLDRSLFKKINHDWTNGFFDHLFLLIRESWFWLPWFLFLFLFAAFNIRKNWWWWILLFLCTVALTDMTGTRLFKHLIARDRPCNDPAFFMSVRMLLKECAGGNSFISNHAANHFGLATFVFFSLREYFQKTFLLIWIWPLLVCYSQLYVGVHYPSDILGGMIVGFAIGYIMSYIFNHRFARNELPPKT